MSAGPGTSGNSPHRNIISRSGLTSDAGRGVSRFRGILYIHPVMRTILIIAAALSFSGCFQQIAVDSLTGIMENGFEVLNEESDLGLAATSIAGNLKLMEAVLRTDPGNRVILMMACRAYSSYAMGFVEDSDPPQIG